ncbi:E3 ubiquitin-protein ligase CCNB1IP1-like [Pieris brassicae]|uniref:E3 ubiquitin-protein ligase CCNB1IP1-like n=1 Tax=Pieris brassicae TaxID=7116 RepID=UPI001E661409|nr:E3 ubiquitin-protein ligase CCNB1IP1-like [Pieris brassicae]
MTLDIVCNFRKCRRSLSSQAWVTTCSHAFCVEHGKSEFRHNAENSLTCPACGNELRDKFDVIQADLKPSETFKSIVLAGLKPDTIMDVAMRAMSFWSYQIEQETLYQETLAKHSKEKLQCLEEASNINMKKLHAELERCKRKITTLQTEFNKKRKQTEELSAKLEDKTRRLQKLTFELESYKRKDIRTNNFQESNTSNRDVFMDISELVVNRVPSEPFIFKPMKDLEESRRLNSPKTPMFDFRHRNKNRREINTSFNFRPIQ